MTATRPSALLMTAFVAIAAVLFVAAATPIVHIATLLIA